MRKILSCFLLIFLLFLITTLIFTTEGFGWFSIPTRIDMVFATPGENASSEINISWHAAVESSTITYTTKDDTNYENGIEITPTAVSSTFESASDGNSGGYTGEVNYYRNIVNLTDLTPGTEYKYKITGTNTTSDYFFKTADESDSFSFIFMSDVHAYPNISARLSTANSLITKAEEKYENLDFVLFSGDLTAHGSDYYQWKHLATAPFTKNYFLATTPGNHDYYKYSNGSVHTSDVYYNAMFDNPKNGAENIPNSSYFFKYNNVLFVGINSEILDYATKEKQKSWLATTIQNNPSDYIIAFSHREFFHGSTASAPGGVSKSSDNYSSYGATLENLGVDLVLTGDDHVYVRTKPILNGQVTTADKGTVYITANQIGGRGRIATSSSEYSEVIYGGTTADNSISTIQVLTVSKTAITAEMFDADGTVHDNYTIPCKKEDIGDFDRDAYANSYDVSINPEDLSLGKVTFTDVGWDKVRDVKICNAAAGDYVYATFEPVEDLTQFLFGTIPAGKTLEIKIIITFKDTTTREVLKTLVNKNDPGSISNLRVEKIEGVLYFKWDNDLVAFEIRDFIFEIDGELICNLEKDATEYNLTDMLVEGENQLTLIVNDIYRDEIFNESITYTYSLDEETPPEEELPEGCKKKALNLFFLFVGFGIIYIKRKENN